jgi:hypothetical protein
LPAPPPIWQASPSQASSAGSATSETGAADASDMRMPDGRSRRCIAFASLMLCTLLTGCGGSPSVGILGAYFPDWLFCAIGGAALTAVVHVLLYRNGRGGWLTPPAIVYPALTLLFATVLWAVVFNL